MFLRARGYKIHTASCVPPWMLTHHRYAQVDIHAVPDFNTMYELYDPCTIMFFFRNKVDSHPHPPQLPTAWVYLWDSRVYYLDPRPLTQLCCLCANTDPAMLDFAGTC